MRAAAEETVTVEEDAEDQNQTDPASTSSAPPMCIDSPVSEMTPNAQETEAEGIAATGTALQNAASAMWVGTLQYVDENERPESDAYLVSVACRDPNIDCDTDCVYDQPSGEGYQWRYPGEGPVTTAADLVATIRAELDELLPAPIVETNPGEGQDAIVNVPTFVYVTNWTGTVTETACAPEDDTFCITGTAEPRMIFDPGEPDADPVDCAGPGQPYDPDHREDDPFVQAEWEETCTYEYTMRTGTGDRPAEWPAEVTVTWDVTWDPADTVGTEFVEQTTEVPLSVTEINAVVTD
jgi:hypothetical protein